MKDAAPRVVNDPLPQAPGLFAHGWNGPAHKRKETTMSKETKPERPLFRVTFSSVKTEKDGNEVVGKPREIGAAWARKNGKKGAIIALDLIPVDFGKGVIFLLPVDADA